MNTDILLIICQYSLQKDVINFTSVNTRFYNLRKDLTIPMSLDRFNEILDYNIPKNFIFKILNCPKEVLLKTKNINYNIHCVYDYKINFDEPIYVNTVEFFVRQDLNSNDLTYIGKSTIIFNNNCDLHDIYFKKNYEAKYIYKNKWCPICYILGKININFNKLIEQSYEKLNSSFFQFATSYNILRILSEMGGLAYNS